MTPQNQTERAAALDYTEEERLAVKYRFLREKIIHTFKKGSRILTICKIVATVLFLLFTLLAVLISRHTGNAAQWLQCWVLIIFLNILIFVIADYAKYLVEAKVIPYLENDEEIEFGEYDIFLEDIDGETDEEDEEEED